MQFLTQEQNYPDSESQYILISGADRDMVINPNRYGEQSPPPFRNRRFYSVNGRWFFDTREREQFGPYRDQSEAKKALAIFVAQKLHSRIADRSDNNRLRHGAQDGIEYMVEELLEFVSLRKNHGRTSALAWANQRLKELLDYRKNISNSKERAQALKYAMDQE